MALTTLHLVIYVVFSMLCLHGNVQLKWVWYAPLSRQLGLITTKAMCKAYQYLI